jgi:predicted amidohydrolase
MYFLYYDNGAEDCEDKDERIIGVFDKMHLPNTYIEIQKRGYKPDHKYPYSKFIKPDGYRIKTITIDEVPINTVINDQFV